jgi:DNA (cytosine-5)-methyltransferase 1
VRALSLFSGIAGLDIAAHAVGIETVAFCEIEPFAVRILNKRFPGIPVFDDVRKITKEVMPDGSLGTIDVVHGGFP